MIIWNVGPPKEHRGTLLGEGDRSGLCLWDVTSNSSFPIWAHVRRMRSVVLVSDSSGRCPEGGSKVHCDRGFINSGVLGRGNITICQ